MFKNYLLVAWRNTWKNKSFSAINIIGLALGLTCSLLVMLWVMDERRIDAFHENTDRIYAVYERQFYDGKTEAGYYTPGILPDELKRVMPEVQYASSFGWGSFSTLAAGEKVVKQPGNFAGEDFFKIFSYPLLQGTTATALNAPECIAVSRKLATKLFGSPEAAIGKTIRHENKRDLKVTAVFEDLPYYSSKKFEYLINWHVFLEINPWAKEWGNNGPNTFIKLQPGASAAKLETNIKNFLDNYNKEQDAGFRLEMGLQRYDETYLHSQFKDGYVSGGRIEYVRIFTAVGIFILLIACINFMNLTTARSVKRAKEIGVRKVVGAMRRSLIGQFIGEALLLTFFAVIIALVLATAFLPVFNQLSGKHINLPYNQAIFWVSVIGLTLVTGLLSGSYPAIMLSSFKPVAVLKGKIKTGSGTAWFRKGLVVFQFTLSILLMVGMVIIAQQVNYVQTKNLGYQRNNLLYVRLEGELLSRYPLFKEEAMKIPGITEISRISNRPTEIDNNTGGVEWVGKNPNERPMFVHAAVGYDFVKTMQLQIKEGRDFSKDFATDSVGYILNESALAKIGYKDPIGKPLTFWGEKGSIVGVIKDFHFNSLHVPIEPIILRLRENFNGGYALIRTGPGRTKQALEGLEKICNELNPAFPFSHQFVDEEYAYLYRSEQVVKKLSNYFAFLAIFISCLGLLGLIIFTAEQRMREIGIRKVLGASVSSLFALLSKDFLILVGIAFVIASPLAWWAMHVWLQNFVYQVPVHWWVFALAGLAATTIALLTVSFQAIRAALVNPVKSLRTE